MIHRNVQLYTCYYRHAREKDCFKSKLYFGKFHIDCVSSKISISCVRTSKLKSYDVIINRKTLPESAKALYRHSRESITLLIPLTDNGIGVIPTSLSVRFHNHLGTNSEVHGRT